MKIALDAMGGDHAPEAIVHGFLEAAPFLKSKVLLVGQPELIKKYLGGSMPSNCEIVPASEVVTMDDKPVDALRKKKDSSMVIAIDMVKRGEADAFVSAGNTGTASAGTLLSWRQIPGIRRPAIAAVLPNKMGRFILLDAGASPDVDPANLVEFAFMGLAYAKNLMDRPNPKVHLLNIGEEPGKGNAFAKEAYEHLSKYSWFAGNIEGKDIFRQSVDIVVCDAFVGNIVLKTSEGVAEYIMDAIREQVPGNVLFQIPFLPMKFAMRPLKKQLDYAEYGGSPLLGVNGVCFICHGRSNPKAIKNALLQAEAAIASGLVEQIRKSLPMSGA
ncbi:MAG: phosphate acyltransferase PlsX [Armatimonadetes bacterium]|nr:phosphate acyltransferase PlsX [Armatimonadota bacterium]